MFSLLFVKSNSIPKIAVNLLNVSRTFSQRHVVCKSSLLSHALIDKPRIHYMERQLCRPHLLQRYNQTYRWEKSTNILNNVILYKNENVRYIKITHIFGICSTICWTFQIWYLYKDKFFYNFWTEPWVQFFNQNMMSVAFLLFTTALGPLFYAVFYFFSQRLITHVILHKGGKHVSFVTLHLLKSRRIITVPVEKVYCLQPRSERLGIYTSVKIDSYKWNFLIDKSGTYVNGDLFDNTVVWRK